jgi:hypothetical protein
MTVWLRVRMTVWLTVRRAVSRVGNRGGRHIVNSVVHEEGMVAVATSGTVLIALPDIAESLGTYLHNDGSLCMY